MKTAFFLLHAVELGLLSYIAHECYLIYWNY